MHLTGWPCTWRNYPHVAISARWRHRWCGKSGLSFSFSFEVLIDDCASLTVPTSITLLARSKPAVSYRILAFAAIVPRSCEVWLTSSSPLRLFIHPRRPATMFRSSLTFIFRYARHADAVYKMYNIRYMDETYNLAVLATNRCIGRLATHLAHLSTRETCFSTVGVFSWITCLVHAPGY